MVWPFGNCMESFLGGFWFYFVLNKKKRKKISKVPRNGHMHLTIRYKVRKIKKMFITNHWITLKAGLDPAGPMFEPPISKLRHVLNHTDAQFVQVLHTAMSGNGNIFRLGAQDFYANGGGLQPGSSDKSWSHQKAVNLFRASIISPEAAVGYECLHGYLQCCQSGLVRQYIFGIHHQCQNAAQEPIYLPTAKDPPYFLSLKLNSCQIPPYGRYYYYNREYVIYSVGILPSRFWISLRWSVNWFDLGFSISLVIYRWKCCFLCIVFNAYRLS